jgi:hypothetical protein
MRLADLFRSQSNPALAEARRVKKAAERAKPDQDDDGDEPEEEVGGFKMAAAPAPAAPQKGVSRLYSQEIDQARAHDSAHERKYSSERGGDFMGKYDSERKK